MSKVEIYTTMLCGYCGAAKRLLNKKGVEFIEYDVMFKSGLRGEMMERSGGATSVPQIFIGDVAIGGSTKVGKGAVLAGASSYADHLDIADGARFTGRAAAGHVRRYEKGDYTGYPAQPIAQWKREQVMIRKLPKLLKRLRALEESVASRP